jgi:SAM-dependent methyltransferase
MSQVEEHNRRVWNRMVEQGQRFTTPARDEEFAQPLASIDSLGWLGPSVAGLRVLCLAAGGGRQGPLFAAAGAIVTVLDISDAMLAHDRQVAHERRLDLATIQGSMDDLSMLPVGHFDLVSQPVSTCYVADVGKVFREVARVMAAGGIYLSQHKQPVSLQADWRPSRDGYALREPYYCAGPLPAIEGDTHHREPGTLEYLHRWEELLGGMCRAGFSIEDVMEPRHAVAGAEQGSFGHRSQYVAPYVRIKARRRAEPERAAANASRLWVPSSNAPLNPFNNGSK